MTDPDNPLPATASTKAPPGPRRRSPAGRGAKLERDRAEMLRYEMALLETPFTSITPVEFWAEEPLSDLTFVGVVGPFRFDGTTRTPKRKAPPPVYRGATAIEQMVLSPSDPGEPFRWTKFAAKVILGMT